MFDAGADVGVEDAEEAVLSGCGIALRFLGALHGFVEGAGDLGAGSECIHGSGFVQRFEHALVEAAEIDLFAELPQAREALLPFCSKFGPSGDDRFDGVVADVLDGGEPEADRLSLFSGDGREVCVGDLDVRRNDGDVHLAALADVLDDVFGLGGFAG